MTIAGIAVGILAGCAQDAAATGEAVALVVANTVEAQVGVRPEVDCGETRIRVDDGAETTCQITDPNTERSYDARVRFINPSGVDQFTITLTIEAEPNQ